MKPPGLRINCDGGLRVVHSSPVEDAVWEAVEQALAAGWSPQRMRDEVADAWQEAMKNAAKEALRILRAP